MRKNRFGSVEGAGYLEDHEEYGIGAMVPSGVYLWNCMSAVDGIHGN